MAQPNVAREPSMDEILASIRKIIESNEPGIPGFPANDLGPASSEDYRSDVTYDDDSFEDVHLTIDDGVLVAEFEAGVQRPSVPAEHPPQEPQRGSAMPGVSAGTPPQSLADVAARVRAASERHAAPLRAPEAAGNAAVKSDSPLVTSRMAPVAASQPANGAPHVETAAVTPAVVSQQPAAAAEEKRDEAQSPSISEPTAQSHPPAVVAEREVAALVSPAVGEQVARSFGDLALAIDSSARRSFDEIAEDMLRPMLQEWLDDNLPTLVERLVREEIERVARGPRR
ncbi:PopZ family protein [Rhizobium herbae]|uniref:PopZ family protein n=1 Tax=Rhizobium herbae TaxID=508661 RepID=A0ABS7H3V0_9HYPH|nr:PopZ family protein [Rhizobium herbae]MBW9061868.1 PopZ family protein [Rhizobium herbae]